MKKNKRLSDVLEHKRISEALKQLFPEEPEIKLHLWQENAVQRWKTCNPEVREIKHQNFDDEEYRGVIQAVTGAGKTILAFECMNVWLADNPTGNITILVPTRALQLQWRGHLRKAFNEPIGVLGGGKRDWQQINVVTMDTAAKGLPDTPEQHLIVADECHNLGSETRKFGVINNPHSAILGLSATPQREDTGLGMVSYLCGPVVFTYGFSQALEDGVIMPFTVRAVQVPLTSEEAEQYNNLTADIKAMSFILKQRYGSHTNIFAIKPDPESGEDGILISFKNLCQERKRILNQSYHRFSCVDEILRMHTENRAMLFHERINQLEWMFEKYNGRMPDWLPDLELVGEDENGKKIWEGTSWATYGMEKPDASEWLYDPPLNPTMYHGEMHRKEADKALADFKAGKSRLLMSVKALREGVDVPDADLGIMVSGTNATRARVQTLGRCLRKGDADRAIVYVLFIDGTTDAKGLANLKYGGNLPSGTIEYWKYDGKGLRFVNKEPEEGETDEERERKRRKPKTRDFVCEKCHKEFWTEEAAKPSNHHCSVAVGRDGRRPVDIWKNLRLK